MGNKKNKTHRKKLGLHFKNKSIAQRNRIAREKLENIQHVPDESPFSLCDPELEEQRLRKNEAKRIKRRREKEALELQLCLEAEFADITSGELDINNAVTIFRLASEKNQTPDEFYREMFENEKKRLREEEEKSFDDSIAHLMMIFKQNLPSMIPLPKQKEIISNIKQMLSDARIEKFGDCVNAKGWTVLESENGSKQIVPSTTKVNVEVKEEPMDFQSENLDVDEIINQSNTSTQEELEMIRIGSEVETTCGLSGILICSSGMGLSPMDLFNDIFTDRRDLEKFLGDNDCKDSDSISLSIKAYLKFCKITKTPFWEPYNPSNEPVTSFELDLYNDGDVFDNTNDYMDDSFPFYDENDSEERIDPEKPSKKDKDSDYVDKSGGPQRKRSKKSKIPRSKQWRPKCGQMKVMDNDMKYARLLDENDIQSIINCCQICFPDNQEYSKVISSSTVKPNAYDVVMSDHLKEKHNIRDKYRELIERMTKIQDSLKDEDFQKENGLFYCTQPNCDYSTRWMMCYHNSEGIADHAEWHRTISKAQIPYLYPDPTSSFQDPQVIARYPCPEDSCRFQTPFLHYGAYAAHKSQNHPEFTWKCQIPNCNFSDAFRYKLNGHITLKHARGNHSCDVCGQVYSTEVALQTHMLKHDPELANRFSCDVCGKTFSTEINFKHHRKLNHEKTIECPLCPEKFKRKQNVEAHLIHAHGQERKYKCDVCGAKFIQNHHRQRHIKQFHGDNPTATLTTIRQRGPNRNQNDL